MKPNLIQIALATLAVVGGIWSIVLDGAPWGNPTAHALFAVYFVCSMAFFARQLRQARSDQAA